jgi:plasmid stabilization system protein ParE
MKIQILSDAQDDLINGYKFYEQQTEELGDYFLDSLYSDINSLELYAGVHPEFFGYYRMLSERFPFAVYYKIEEPIVKVYAVLDCRRKPPWIRDRLE